MPPSRGIEHVAAALMIVAGWAASATTAFAAAEAATQESQSSTSGEPSDPRAALLGDLRAEMQASLDQAAARLQIRASQDREWQDFSDAIDALAESAVPGSTPSAAPAAPSDGAALLSLGAEEAMRRAQALDKVARAAASLQRALDSNQRDVFAQIVRMHLGPRASGPWDPMMDAYPPLSDSDATQSEAAVDPPGGGGAGAHGGGSHGGAFQGTAAGGGHVGPSHGGGAVGGSRSAPIPRGPTGDLHHHYNGGGFRGGWWGPGWFGLDLYLATLPWYYEAYEWDGVPYYYVNGNYWVWNGDVGEYEQVQPPAPLATEGPGEAPNQALRLFVYPKNGQSAQQQSKDEAECSQWASGQTSYAPSAHEGRQSGGAAVQNSEAASAQRQDYLRAESACLEARGYSVE